MRLLVCGSRGWTDRDFLFAKLDDFASGEGGCTVVIHGGARGADTLAGEWAAERGVAVEVYPADWKTYGRAAGMLRNRRMLHAGHPDRVVAFRCQGDSRGTDGMVALAKAAGVPGWLYRQ